MEAIAFERDIDEYEINMGEIDTILSGQRRVSVVLSSTSANKRKPGMFSTRSLVLLKYKIDVREQQLIAGRVCSINAMKGLKYQGEEFFTYFCGYFAGYGD